MLLDIYTSYDPYRPMLAFVEKYKTEILEWKIEDRNPRMNI